MSELAVVDTVRLGELEDIVERGVASFIEVGNALLEIRELRLYAKSHPTFEAYCTQRWSMGRNYANKLIVAAQVGTTVPVANERQAREFAPFLDDPEELKEVYSNVVAINENPTALDIKRAVATRIAAKGAGFSEEEKTSIVTRYVNGESQKSIAAALGMSQQNVSRIVTEAKKKAGDTSTRKSPSTPEGKLVRDIQSIVRRWQEIDDEQWLNVTEAARRARVLEDAISFLKQKREAYAFRGASLLKKGSV